MVKQAASVAMSFPNESADVESEEASEEEEEFEEDLDEEGSSEVEANEEHCEDPDEEEELCEEDPNEEEELCEEDPNEEEEPSDDYPIEEEPCEEVVSEEESSEKSDEDLSEEDPPGADNDHGEVHQVSAIPSNSGKKQADSLEGNLQKRQKPDPNLKLKSRDGLSSIKRRSRWDKERHSRWDTVPGSHGKADSGGDVAKKKRKTRWASGDNQFKKLGPLELPDFSKAREIQNLNIQLLEINRKLRAREICDDRPENERSPSPPPIYGYLGIKINTREARLREKLIKQRSKIVSDLIQRDPTFNSPLDHKRPKFTKRLYIPVNEYPGYNSTGLIVAPSGLTMKRMEKESGAYIKLQGKGSVRESKSHPNNNTENEGLHFYIKARSQESVDAAVAMVEKLLVPVEEEKNELKHAQLRELAKLRGTLDELYTPRVPKITSKTNFSCEICGDASHLTAACPLTASNPGTGPSYHQLGKGLFTTFTGPQVPISTVPWMANASSGSLTSSVKVIDEAKLFVGHLPPSVNGDKLIELFLPFGQICEAIILKDKTTGLSKGCGFIKYVDAISAAEAISRMNGYNIEGNMLSVRLAGHHPSTPGTGTSDHQIESLNKTTHKISAPIGRPQGPSSTIPPMANLPLGALSSNNSKPVKEIDETKLFVGYLPQSVNEDKLIELFLPFGQIIEAIVIRDKSTGLSKGSGFLKYADATSAAEAIARMNGCKIEGKMLAVRLAGHPPSMLGTGTSENQIDPLTKPVKEIDEATLFIGYLPQSVNGDKLIELFLPFGQICEARVVKDRSTGSSKGCGFIKYVDAMSAADAIARMNGYRIEGKMLAVRVAGSPPSTSGTGPSGHQIDYLTKIGNELSATFTGPQVLPLMANAASGALSSENSKPVKEIDEAKLFVGSLPQSVNEDKLIELFLPFGQIYDAIVLKDKNTGLSKGYGFVKYVDAIFAAEAAARMNGYMIEGKMLAVRVAGCPPATPATGTSGHQIDSHNKHRNEPSATFTGPQVPISTIPLMVKSVSGDLSSEYSKPVKEKDEAKLYVGFLPQSVNEDKLIELFLPFGQIYEAIVIKDKSTGLSKGYGFVKYVDAIFAAEAVAQMNGYKIDGKMLMVRVAGSPPSMPGTSNHQIYSLASLSNKPSAAFTGPQVPISTVHPMANPASVASSSEYGKPVKEIDEAKLYVGFLPQSVNDDKLIGLFLPFGPICEAIVVKDKSTGLSKGYGFVKYVDAIFAAEAVARLNGYRIEGKMLDVRVAGCPPSTDNFHPVPGVPQSYTHLPTYSGPAGLAEGKPGLVPAAITQGSYLSGVPQSFSHLPTYPVSASIAQWNPTLVPAAIPQNFTHLPTYPGRATIAQGNLGLVPAAITRGNPGPMDWPGPPGYVLSDPYAFFPKYNGFAKHSDPVSIQSPTYFGSLSQTPASFSLIPGGITSSSELAQFPGYLNSL